MYIYIIIYKTIILFNYTRVLYGWSSLINDSRQEINKTVIMQLEVSCFCNHQS